MMISPESFVEEHKNDSFKELIKTRDSLMREIKSLEKIVYSKEQSDEAWMISPGPDVQYQVYLEYLAELCKFISRKYNEEIVWNEDEPDEEENTLKDIIRNVMTERGMTNATLAEKCGYNTPSGVSNILGRDSGMRVENLLKIMEAMDCEVVIRSKTDNKEWIIGKD